MGWGRKKGVCQEGLIRVLAYRLHYSTKLAMQQERLLNYRLARIFKGDLIQDPITMKQAKVIGIENDILLPSGASIKVGTTLAYRNPVSGVIHSHVRVLRIPRFQPLGESTQADWEGKVQIKIPKSAWKL